MAEMMSRPDVVVLGAHGFVGSAICDYLDEAGMHVLQVGRANYATARGTKTPLFINANGSSDKRLAASDPLRSFHLNVESGMRSIFDFPAERYLLISSVDVYPVLTDPRSNAESEQIHGGALTEYGLIKLLAEMVVTRFAKRTTIFRLGPLVGPRLRKNPIFDLLERRTLYMNPESRLSFIDTRDVARIVWTLREQGGEVFNVAGIGTVCLRDVAQSLGVSLPAGVETLARTDYNINVDKLSGIIDVPLTSVTIARYLGEQMRSRA